MENTWLIVHDMNLTIDLSTSFGSCWGLGEVIFMVFSWHTIWDYIILYHERNWKKLRKLMSDQLDI